MQGLFHENPCRVVELTPSRTLGTIRRILAPDSAKSFAGSAGIEMTTTTRTDSTPTRLTHLVGIAILTAILTTTSMWACAHELDTAAIDQAVEAEMARQRAVGVAIGVIQDGEVRYTKGYGFENREASIPVTNKTMFRWASISKPLTGIAAAQLVESGKLDLDADIRTLVPEFPDKGETITTRQLLGHLGGIVHYSNGPVVRTQREYEEAHPYESVILALDTFKESPLVARPGEEFAYSTHGFILASAVIERAGGAPFSSQVDERITRVLELDSLQPDYQWKDIPNRAVGYRQRNGQVVPSTNTDVSWKLGGGGFVSTIDDLAAFAAALDDDRFITPRMRQLLFTPQTTAKGKSTRYGLGFNARRQSPEGDLVREDALVVSHTGAQEKVRGLLEMQLDTGDGIVVLTNSEYAKPRDFARVIKATINETRESP